jgi:peptide/nickel transport system substrate-binding protein
MFVEPQSCVDLLNITVSGDIPPLDERLPDEPVVVMVEESVGEFGGVYVAWNTSDEGNCCELYTRRQYMMHLNPRTGEIEPNILSQAELSEDETALTMVIRSGLRWSDGVAVTTDDVRFWWEDLMLNEEFTPSLSQAFRKSDGTPMQVIILDDYTFRFVWDFPNPDAYLSLATVWHDSSLLAPGYYLKRFHPTYNKDARTGAVAAGFDDWTQRMRVEMDVDSSTVSWYYPVLRPWKLHEVKEDGTVVFWANPYFWKVDSQGNQLPYICTYVQKVVESRDVADTRAVAGEFTVHAFGTADSAAVELAQRNAESGGYTVNFLPMGNGSDAFIPILVSDTLRNFPLESYVPPVSECFLWNTYLPEQFWIEATDP